MMFLRLALILALVGFPVWAPAQPTLTGAGHYGVAAPATGTLSSVNINAGMTLSPDKLSVTSNGSGQQSVLSTTGHSSGKYCAGIKTNNGAGGLLFGPALASSSRSVIPGFDGGSGDVSLGWFYNGGAGNVFANSTNLGVAYGWGGIGAWNVLCFDIDAHSVTFYNASGTLLGTQTFGVAGTYFMDVGAFSDTIDATIDFAGTNFTPPAGYSVWG